MYLDLYRFFYSLRKRRVIVQLITFIISAVIHEFIIFYAIGFFYPILFILFTGPGTSSLSCRHRLHAAGDPEEAVGQPRLLAVDVHRNLDDVHAVPGGGVRSDEDHRPADARHVGQFL
jgi:hypothetical protein